MPTNVYLLRERRELTTEEREHVDRFVAAFVAKYGTPPAGNWRVPGVGYCSFFKDPD
jgi:hypothetical protein